MIRLNVFAEKQIWR